MSDNHAPSPVVVGIDGSATATAAALWAVDEAVSRRAPMRLIYATTATHPSAEGYTAEIAEAKRALQAAQAAVSAVNAAVDVETEVVAGPPGAALIAESATAAMICVGSVGIGRYARSIVGSTAADLAENARCPVAIIRPQADGLPIDINWIVVAFNAQPGHERVVEQAMAEAKLRGAPVLALGDRRRPTHNMRSALDHEIELWTQRYPGVRIYPVDDGADVAHFLKRHDERVLLAVIGDSETDQIAGIVGRPGQQVFHHVESSALVVRG